LTTILVFMGYYKHKFFTNYGYNIEDDYQMLFDLNVKRQGSLLIKARSLKLIYKPLGCWISTRDLLVLNDNGSALRIDFNCQQQNRPVHYR
jgi:hypothetical protein